MVVSLQIISVYEIYLRKVVVIECHIPDEQIDVGMELKNRKLTNKFYVNSIEFVRRKGGENIGLTVLYNNEEEKNMLLKLNKGDFIVLQPSSNDSKDQL